MKNANFLLTTGLLAFCWPLYIHAQDTNKSSKTPKVIEIEFQGGEVMAQFVQPDRQTNKGDVYIIFKKPKEYDVVVRGQHFNENHEAVETVYMGKLTISENGDPKYEIPPPTVIKRARPEMVIPEKAKQGLVILIYRNMSLNVRVDITGSKGFEMKKFSRHGKEVANGRK